MALVARALLPSDDTIAGWASLAPAQAWAAIPADVWGALATALGDAQLDNPALFAALPPEQVRVSIGTAGLNPIMGTKVKLMYAALRIKYGMEPLDCYGGPGNAAAGASVAAGSGSPASGTQGAVMKVRIATVLDQASDREIELLDGTTLAALRRTYKVNQGGPPTEVEEVTDAQLSALARVVRAGGVSIRGLRRVGSVWQSHRKAVAVHPSLHRWGWPVAVQGASWSRFRGGLGAILASLPLCRHHGRDRDRRSARHVRNAFQAAGLKIPLGVEHLLFGRPAFQVRVVDARAAEAGRFPCREPEPLRLLGPDAVELGH